MPLRIYNSLTGTKQLFEPLEKNRVRMYVCGPTVYDVPHVGHLRSAFVFQVIRNYLEFRGIKFILLEMSPMSMTKSSRRPVNPEVLTLSKRLVAFPKNTICCIRKT